MARLPYCGGLAGLNGGGGGSATRGDFLEGKEYALASFLWNW